MISKRSRRQIGIAVALALLVALPLSAQDFSPHFKTTGKGAYDLYNDTVLCSAVMERAIEVDPHGEQGPHLERGINYSVNFALFLLASGDVVDMSGAILAPDNLPIDRRNARSDWQAVLLSSLEEEEETATAEIARCLRLYGHDWK